MHTSIGNNGNILKEKSEKVANNGRDGMENHFRSRRTVLEAFYAVITEGTLYFNKIYLICT